MRYEIILAPEAVDDLRRLRAFDRAEIQDALERYLRHEPTKTSRSRIKRLNGVSHPEYRLRIGDDLRVFYDVARDTVEVLAIVSKPDADAWLEQHGEPDEESGAL